MAYQNNLFGLLKLKEQIITSIVNEKKYVSICKKLAKSPHLAEDLYQEFMLQVLEIKDDRLTKANEGNYLTVFCVGIINNIWNNRGRVKSYSNGSTSPLFEFSRSRAEGVDYEYLLESKEYDSTIDVKYDKALEVINKDRSSNNKTVWFESNIFYHSTHTHSNPYQLSKNSNIYYRTAYNAYKNYLKRLKEKI